MKTNFVQTGFDSVQGENKFFSFKSECSCFSHDLKVHLEKDIDLDLIQVIFYDDVYIGEDCKNKSIIKNIMLRLKFAFKCLFNDGFAVEHGFVFKGEEHLKQFLTYFNERANEILKDKNNSFIKKKYFKRRYKKESSK